MSTTVRQKKKQATSERVANKQRIAQDNTKAKRWEEQRKSKTARATRPTPLTQPTLAKIIVSQDSIAPAISQ